MAIEMNDWNESPFDPEAVRERLEELLYCCISKWEEDFLESLLEQLDDGRTLTKTQLDKLAQIEADRL